jgi:hypothetical protein
MEEPEAVAASDVEEAAREARQVRRQKRVLALAVIGFLVVSVVGLSSLVLLEIKRERQRNREIAQREAAAREAGAPRQAANTASLSLATHAATAPRIDGALESDAWGAAPPSELAELGEPEEAAPSLATRFQVLWDERALYFALEVEDLELIAAGAPSAKGPEGGFARQGDSVGLRLDLDGDGSPDVEVAASPAGARLEAPSAPAGLAGGFEQAVKVEGTLNRPGDRDRGWTLEAAVPWAVLRAMVETRRLLGERADLPTTPPPLPQRWSLTVVRVRRPVETATRELGGRPDPVRRWNWPPGFDAAAPGTVGWGTLELVTSEAAEVSSSGASP